MSIHNQYFETSHRNVVMEDYNINLVYLTHHFQYKDGMKSWEKKHSAYVYIVNRQKHTKNRHTPYE